MRFRLMQVKYDDLVGSFVQEGSGAIQAVLGADFPVTAQVVPVNPYHSFFIS
jgi:hypothetical protein